MGPRKKEAEKMPVEVAAEPLPKPAKAKKAVSATAKKKQQQPPEAPGNVVLPAPEEPVKPKRKRAAAKVPRKGSSDEE